ncbi:MAG: hypothetical protein PHQ27_11280, partial [Victivallales bacterium]|nr:hypothetical protein [Victivallales bacterium]
MKRKTVIRNIVIAIGVVVIVLIGLRTCRSYVPEEVPMEFETTPVERADIIRAISATGTVEPEELINVGAQVNGK